MTTDRKSYLLKLCGFLIVLIRKLKNRPHCDSGAVFDLGLELLGLELGVET